MSTTEVLIGKINKIDNHEFQEKIITIAKEQLEKVYSINVPEEIYKESNKKAEEILTLTNQLTTIVKKRDEKIKILKKTKELSDNYIKKYREFPELNPEEYQKLSANIQAYIELEEALFKTGEFVKNQDLLRGTKCFEKGLDKLLEAITNNKNYIPDETLQILKEVAQEIAENFMDMRKNWQNKSFDISKILKTQEKREKLKKINKEIVKTSKAIVYEIEQEITKIKNNKSYAWEEEEKKLNELLEHMEEWSKQKYTDEEKEAFERVMARLNRE